MARIRILLEGSLEKPGRRRDSTIINENRAKEFAALLGRRLIESDLDLMFISPTELEAIIAEAAVGACIENGQEPTKRIRTYVYSDHSDSDPVFGMVLPALGRRRWEEGRAKMVMEADAIVALAGGRGTSDTLQKAQLAGLPIFPIAYAGGAAKQELERLRLAGADLDYLAALNVEPEDMISKLTSALARLKKDRPLSRRVFIVHGHETGLKNEVARLLTRLGLLPVVLHEQVDTGRTLFSKLQEELSDVGFAMILITPDDLCRPTDHSGDELRARARQNVVFEYGWLVGALGPNRVCVIVKGDVEFPSDLLGITHKKLQASQSLSSIALDIVMELSSAGYDVDANALLRG
jgi:predicted nucleotide-binding protein